MCVFCVLVVWLWHRVFLFVCVPIDFEYIFVCCKVFKCAYTFVASFVLSLLPLLRKLFFVALLANIMNGFHLNSYVFIGKLPDQYWCDVPALQQNGWSKDRIREISAV